MTSSLEFLSKSSIFHAKTNDEVRSLTFFVNLVAKHSITPAGCDVYPSNENTPLFSFNPTMSFGSEIKLRFNVKITFSSADILLILSSSTNSSINLLKWCSFQTIVDDNV